MQQQSDLRPVRVLIVDDNDSMRAVLRTLLRREGYDLVGELADGAALLPMVARLHPDIVCLDQNLPGTPGLELLNALRVSCPDLSVIMLTGATDPQLEQMAVAAGASGFLRKPFSPAQILETLRQVAHAGKTLRRAASARTGDAASLAAGAVRSVVLADDSAAMRQLLRVILQGMGLNVLGEAANGQEALDLVAEHSPDVVCLDVEMPVMDGMQALCRLHVSHPALRVVMITGHAERALVLQALAQGAKGYLLKPYEPEKVAAALRQILA